MDGGPRPPKARLAATDPRLAVLLAVAMVTLVTWAAGLGNAAAIDAPSAVGPQAPPTPDLPPQLRATEARSAYGMVASSISEASQAGAQMLAHGGNAVDAAVATAFALGVADPFYSGIGGVSYLLLRLHDGHEVAIDGTAPVPIRAVPDELEVLKEWDTMYGYKTIAVPTAPAALAFALKRYGTMSLAQVLAPAIDLAENGHTFLPLAQGIVERAEDLTKIRENEYLSRTFLRNGSDYWPLGHIYCQPQLAATLRRLAAAGVEDFYSGWIANEMVADIAAHGGYVSKGDLARVRIAERTPVHGRYRDLEVVSFPYPGAGSVVVSALEILDAFPAELLKGDWVDRSHLLLEAERIAAWEAGETARAPQRLQRLVDPVSPGGRAALIRLDRALYDSEISSGQPHQFREKDTTQVSVVDRFGNAVSLTQSLGMGSYVATPSLGFHYNSLLESYDFLDRRSPTFLSPVRTQESPIAPTILVCNGAPFLVLGGPGSGRIPATIVQVVTNVVDRGMTLKDAVADPRILFNPPIETPDSRVYLELAGPNTPERADALRDRGFADQKRLTFPAKPHDYYPFGGVNAVMVDPATGMLVGAGDPRRQGAAAAPDHL